MSFHQWVAFSQRSLNVIGQRLCNKMTDGIFHFQYEYIYIYIHMCVCINWTWLIFGIDIYITMIYLKFFFFAFILMTSRADGVILLCRYPVSEYTCKFFYRGKIKLYIPCALRLVWTQFCTIFVMRVWWYDFGKGERKKGKTPLCYDVDRLPLTIDIALREYKLY